METFKVNAQERRSVVREVMSYLEERNAQCTGSDRRDPEQSETQIIERSAVGDGIRFLLPAILTAVGMVSSLPIYWSAGILILALGSYLALGLDYIPLFKTTGYRRLGWLLVALLPFVALMSFGPYIHSRHTEEKAAQLSGDLSPSEIKIAPDSTSNSIPLLQIGDGGTKLQFTGDQNTPMSKGGPDKLWMRRVKGDVKISLEVRNKNGETIVQIAQNHWIVSANAAVCWDKNYTDNSLEVLDGSRRVVLQIRLFADGIQLQMDGTGVNYFEDGKDDPEEGIKPIFLYPSSQNWGKFTNNYIIQ